MILVAKYIITGDGRTLLKDHAVRVEGDKITEVGPLGEMLQKYPGEPVEDYGDATILPGLIDLHQHLGTYIHYSNVLQFNDFLLAYKALHAAQEAFAVGVTTIRDVSSDHLLVEKMRQAAKLGYVVVPRLYHCDRGITMTGGHADQITNIKNECEVADGIDELRKAIRGQLRAGADWIKVMDSHRVLTRPEFSQEELDFIVQETHRLERKCCVHAGVGPSVQMSIDAGFDTIEHATFMTEDQAKQMKEKGLAWIPTIITYTWAAEVYADENNQPVQNAPQSIKNFWWFFQLASQSYRDNFKKLYDTGVFVGAGTDMVMAGSPPAPLAMELEYYVRYGVPVLEAIKCGTANNAKILDAEDRFGMIREGLSADILVCEGDVSSDIKQLQKVKKVFLEGKCRYEA